MPRRSVVDPRFPARLRELREERGVSLRALAARVNSNSSSLSEYETGKTLPSRETVRLLDVALSAGGELLGMLPSPPGIVFDGLAGGSGGEPDKTLWVPSHTAAIVGRFTREDLALERRQAIRGVAGVLFGTALLERLERWLLDDAEPVAEPHTPGIGYEEVEQLEFAARVFRSWDNQFGGGLVRKAVVGQLNEVAEELRDNSHPAHLRQRLFSAMSQLACTAATMSWDSGRGPTAQQYYLMALRAAKQSGDRAFGANVLAGMARQLLYLGRTVEALEMVRLAQNGADGHATPRVRAMLYTREAWAYAAQGRIGAFRRTTGRAEDALRDARPDEDPYWITYFDEAELAGVTGGRLLELAHERRDLAPETADHIERAVRSRRGLSLRSSALDKIGLAEARLVQDEPEEASRLGMQAADIVAQTQSDRVKVKLAEFYRCTDKYANHPAIAALRPRIRELAAAR